jgi:hypothetical protein
VTQWAVRHWTPDRLSHSQAYGYRAHFGYVTATGASSQGVTFRLIQPTHGFSTFTEHLITRGEGVHSICATTLEPETLQELTALEELTVAQASAFPDGSTLCPVRHTAGTWRLLRGGPERHHFASTAR